MGRTVKRWTPVALALAAWLAAGGATADTTKADAEKHFKAGNALVDNEDYAAATAEFELSVRIYPTKMGLFNLANCYKALTRYGDALEALARLEREFAGKLGDLATEVQTLKITIEGMVGRLDVRVDQDGASILVDGAEIGRSPLAGPLVFAPGDHVVEARLPGFATAAQTVRVAAREESQVALALAKKEAAPPGPVVAPSAEAAPPATAEAPPAAQPAPPPALPERNKRQRAFRAGAWASFIVGVGAGLVAGALYGLASTEKDVFAAARDDYDAAVEDLEVDGPSVAIAEDGRRAWRDMVSSKEAGEKLEKAGLGFAIGAGALVAAATGLFMASRGEAKAADAKVAVSAAPGGVVLEF